METRAHLPKNKRAKEMRLLMIFTVSSTFRRVLPRNSQKYHSVLIRGAAMRKQGIKQRWQIIASIGTASIHDNLSIIQSNKSISQTIWTPNETCLHNKSGTRAQVRAKNNNWFRLMPLTTKGNSTAREVEASKQLTKRCVSSMNSDRMYLRSMEISNHQPTN